MDLENNIRKHKEVFQAQVPINLHEGFEALLEKELPQKKSKKTMYWFTGVVASIALLLAIVSISYNNTVEHDILLALNNENSSVDRLKGIYEYQELQKEDNQFITKLIELLHNKDENNNVKIAAIDALKDFPNNDNVREALIEALEKEEEPIIQIELIKAISELREKRATSSLQKIINNQKTIDYVKESALYTYNQLK